MQKLEAAANAAKESYFFVIDGIANHPHLTFWSGVAAVIALLVL